jgi:Predicted secreted protein
MTWVSLAAVYFIIWWIMLFVSLPLGLRTQDEEQEVVMGTTPSAPAGRHMLRAIIITTLLSFVVMGLFLLVTRVLGYSFDDIPNIMPDFGFGTRNR